MITLISSTDICWQGMDCHPVSMACIDALAQAPCHDSLFWSLVEEQKPLAYLATNGGCLYIAGGKGREDTIWAFAHMVGFHTIETDLILPTQSNQQTSYTAMAYTGSSIPLPLGHYQYCHGTTAQHSVFSLAKIEHQSFAITHDEIDTFTVNLSHRVRHSTALTSCLTDDVSQIFAVGAITHIGGGYGYIGGIAVLPHHRHQGYGQRITNYLVAQCQRLEITPVLCCDNDIATLYQQIGFDTIAPIYGYHIMSS